MAITRWEPFREVATLRNAMDRLFYERFFQPLRSFEGLNFGVPMDVYEEADKYVVEATLPGLRAEDVDISLQGTTLTISGEIPYVEPENRNYLLRERMGGRFSRSITLPVEVQSDSVEAIFHDGVLHLTLPKSPAYQPKKITVRAQ